MTASPSDRGSASRTLILASASPRRRQLLEEAKFDFVIEPADIDEENHPPLAPGDLAQWLAVAKCAVIADRFPSDVVLAADTVVALGSQILGKPTNAAHAREMLGQLSGTIHEVITGVAIVCRANSLKLGARVHSTVQMRKLLPGEIDQYVATGQWMGKAGGYGIQDADPFVTRISGDLTNIVGLPMQRTTELLAAAGIRPRTRTASGCG